MKFSTNRQEVEKLDVDFLGYIFYAPSKRFVGENPEPGLFNSEKPGVGVFVNENAVKILGLAKKYHFGWVQLHGKENPETCRFLKKHGLKIIKAFNVDENFNFSATGQYENVVNFFLFDTKTKNHGGSGKKFDWEILENYKGQIPFFLSGGIGPEDIESIKNLDHPKITGVDLNSRFEDFHGQKNIEKLKKFITEIKTINETASIRE